VNSHICQICGDDVGVTPEGELFAACHECGFPVCRPCYEYERKDGTQACPQCRTRYNRHKGKLKSPIYTLPFAHDCLPSSVNSKFISMPRLTLGDVQGALE
jgi:hypothetical protein